MSNQLRDDKAHFVSHQAADEMNVKALWLRMAIASYTSDPRPVGLAGSSGGIP
jgi:hypothetical protein